MLAALTHPRTSGSAAIRQNVLRPLPMLLRKCGASMRNSLEQVVPHLAERLVDHDLGVRSLACRALVELLTVVRASVVIPALLNRSVIGRSVRVREAVLTLLAHVLHQRDPPPGEELPTACCKEFATFLRQLDEPTTSTGQAALQCIQQLYALHPAGVRAQLASNGRAAGIPQGAARHANGRIEEFERGVAPTLPPMAVAYPAPPPLPTPPAMHTALQQPQWDGSSFGAGGVVAPQSIGGDDWMLSSSSATSASSTTRRAHR